MVKITNKKWKKKEKRKKLYRRVMRESIRICWGIVKGDEEDDTNLNQLTLRSRTHTCATIYSFFLPASIVWYALFYTAVCRYFIEEWFDSFENSSFVCQKKSLHLKEKYFEFTYFHWINEEIIIKQNQIVEYVYY